MTSINNLVLLIGAFGLGLASSTSSLGGEEEDGALPDFFRAPRRDASLSSPFLSPPSSLKHLERHL